MKMRSPAATAGGAGRSLFRRYELPAAALGSGADEPFAAARGLALPSQLRRMLREKGRDLHGEFLQLLPKRPRPIRIQRWSARRAGLLLLIVALAALLVPAAQYVLANDYQHTAPLNIESLRCGEPEPLWLLAQSVPSASLVPCVRGLPPGWAVATAKASNGLSEFTLAHDPDSQAMTVRLLLLPHSV